MLAFLDFFGIAVFAISGALTAAEKRMDIFGVMVVAMVTCLGGGTLRDVILDAHPVVWIANTAYLGIGITAALVTFLVARYRNIPHRALEVCDAVGLAFFTLAGTQKAQSLGLSWEICVIMGLMTGVAGGIIRDIICNEIPLIFHREIYATAAIAGSISYLVATHLAAPPFWAILLSMGSTLGLRLSGIFLGLSLPSALTLNHHKEP